MKRRMPKGNESKVQVAVTPFLDFAFQLLAFFVVASHPSLPEGEMDLALPTEKPTVAATTNTQDVLDKDPGDDEDPKEPPEVTVLIDAVVDGNKETIGSVKEIFLILKEKPEEKIPVTAEGWDVEHMKPLLDKLQDQLKKLRETLTNKKDVIMKADRKLKWQYIVRVRDACEKAGFSNANFGRK